MRNKRRHHRFMTAGRIRLFAGGELLLEASLLDISLGGILLKTFQEQEINKLVLNQVLTFKCQLSTGKLEGSAQAVWIGQQPSCAGLRILQMRDMESEKNLSAYVANDFLG